MCVCVFVCVLLNIIWFNLIIYVNVASHWQLLTNTSNFPFFHWQKHWKNECVYMGECLHAEYNTLMSVNRLKNYKVFRNRGFETLFGWSTSEGDASIQWMLSHTVKDMSFYEKPLKIYE